MRRLIPTVLRESDLPLALLSAARLDGMLWSIFDGFAPVDEPDGLELRLQALERSVPRGAVVVGRTAAWAHGACTRVQAPLEVCEIGRRTGGSLREGIRTREIRLTSREIVSISNAKLGATNRLRTILDLAMDPTRRAGDASLVISLCEGDVSRIRNARHELAAASQRPGKAQGVAWLCEIEGYASDGCQMPSVPLFG